MSKTCHSRINYCYNTCDKHSSPIINAPDQRIPTLMAQVEELVDKINKLTERITSLEAEVKYIPGGEEYQKAEEHFNSLVPNTS